MKRQSLMALALMGMSAGFAINAQAGEETAATTMNNNKNMKPDCSKMTSDEQSFSSKLNDQNRNMFCSKFSASQRKSAMMLNCKGPSNCGSNKSSKKIMAPNDAVAKVAKDNRISMDEKRESATQPSDALQAQAEAPAAVDSSEAVQ